MDATRDAGALDERRAEARENSACAYQLAKEAAIRAQDAAIAAECALRDVEARQRRLLERSRRAADYYFPAIQA